MKILASCPACLGEVIRGNAQPDEIRRVVERRYSILITHERSATSNCQEGHAFSVIITEPAYSLVFERGLQRLADRDWRDAVLDAYTARHVYHHSTSSRAI